MDKKTGNLFEGVDRGAVWTSNMPSRAKYYSTRKAAREVIEKLAANGCRVEFEAVKLEARA